MPRFDTVAWVRTRLPPGLFLLFLAPFIAELLSVHQKPLQFFMPLQFLMTALPYGFGAILVRELNLRWGGGWLRLLVLALAYGVFEEGIVIRSFYNPEWGELGPLANHDFIAGLNWVYSFALLHFHVVFSIWASITIADIVFDRQRRQSWVGGLWFWLCLAGFALWVPVGWVMSAFVPPLGYYLGGILVFAGLIGLARFLPANWPAAPPRRSVAHPALFLAIGMANVFVVYITVFIAPQFGAVFPTFPTFAFLVLVNATMLFALERLSCGFSAWGDRHRIALVTGFLSVFFVLSVLSDLIEGFGGSAIVAIAFAFFLWQLWKSCDEGSAEPDLSS